MERRTGGRKDGRVGGQERMNGNAVFDALRNARVHPTRSVRVVPSFHHCNRRKGQGQRQETYQCQKRENNQNNNKSKGTDKNKNNDRYKDKIKSKSKTCYLLLLFSNTATTPTVLFSVTSNTPTLLSYYSQSYSCSPSCSYSDSKLTCGMPWGQVQILNDPPDILKVTHIRTHSHT